MTIKEDDDKRKLTIKEDDDRYKPKKRKSTSVLRKSVIAKNDGHDNVGFKSVP